jgi:hypothetical protein
VSDTLTFWIERLSELTHEQAAEIILAKSILNATLERRLSAALADKETAKLELTGLSDILYLRDYHRSGQESLSDRLCAILDAKETAEARACGLAEASQVVLTHARQEYEIGELSGCFLSHGELNSLEDALSALPADLLAEYRRMREDSELLDWIESSLEPDGNFVVIEWIREGQCGPLLVSIEIGRGREFSGKTLRDALRAAKAK